LDCTKYFNFSSNTYNNIGLLQFFTKKKEKNKKKEVI